MRLAPLPLSCLGLAVLAGALPAQQPTYVANEAPQLSAARTWRVGPVLMQAGQVQDPSGLELARVASAIRLSDGRVVVANGGSRELIFLSPSGAVLLRAGRNGEGPGEFRFLAGLGSTPAGEIWAADQSQRVIHLFDATGKFSRTVSLKEFQVPGGLFPAGMLADGRFVLFNAATPLGGPAAGFDSTDIVLLDPRTNRSTTITRLPKTDMGDPLGSKSFGAPLILSVGASSVWWGFGDQYRVHRLNPEGRVVGGLTRRAEAIPLSGSLWARYLDSRAASYRAFGRTDEEIARLRQNLEASSRPARLPYFSEAMGDTGGNLWVRGFEMSGVIVPDWDVFDPSGTWLTTLSMPERFRPTQIGADWILGVQRDEDGVESVALRRLIKPS